jgi:GntR family transcriptional regulator
VSIDFDILPSDPVPIYRQIVDQVRRRVACGSLAAGHELPSVRALAQAHAINPMTVSKAYSLLETEGLLERRRGMGMFVAAVRPARSASRRLALLEPALQAAAQQASELGLGAGQALQLFERCLARAGLPGGPVEEEP